MGWIDFLILLVIAGFCGAIGQALAGYSRGGCLVSIILGFVGATIGRWLATKMQLPEVFSLSIGGVNFPVIWSVIGAALFVAGISFISGRRN